MVEWLAWLCRVEEGLGESSSSVSSLSNGTSSAPGPGNNQLIRWSVHTSKLQKIAVNMFSVISLTLTCLRSYSLKSQFKSTVVTFTTCHVKTVLDQPVGLSVSSREEWEIDICNCCWGWPAAAEVVARVGSDPRSLKMKSDWLIIQSIDEVNEAVRW